MGPAVEKCAAALMLSWGNRCGHSPDAPRLRLTFEPRRRRPRMVRKLLARSERFYWRRPLLLVGIASRSELAQAIVLVIKALLLEWCQVTSRVGWRRPDGTVAGISVEVLARWTGLSVGRVARAVGALKRAGLLKGSQPRERKDERWIGYPSVRWISHRLFYLLGVSENELRQAAQSAAHQRTKHAAPTEPEDRPGEPTPVGELAVVAAARLERLARHFGKGRPPDG